MPKQRPIPVRTSSPARSEASERRPHTPRDGRVRPPATYHLLERYAAKRAHRRRTLQAWAMVLALAVIACAGWGAASALSGVLSPSATGDANASAHAADAPTSTPAAEWRQGEVPELYQKDPQWAEVPYAEAAFGESGCGPTCLAMVYVMLTGATDKTPADLAALSTRMGCASADGTSWTFMTEGAAELGLSATEVPADEWSMREALVAGSPIICSMGPGDFTTIGHFIVLAGIDQNGRLIVRDPNSPERTQTTWEFDTVISQARAMWSYTRA